MVTAVDTSVLLDVLTNHSSFAEVSKSALRQAFQEGSLIVNETVIAELSPALSASQFRHFLDDWELNFVPSSLESALLAGEMFRYYIKQGGKRDRVLPDLLIGAHAQKHANRLLARDRGYFKNYFKHLKVWDPSLK
ncbi:MAG: type II toxin-antitoxin system VapC family toxin [Verrucomicrobiia bacterium]|nr:type II toxin-antitoxin system VapC family toxin [Verrucomicrobiae bacterium]